MEIRTFFSISMLFAHSREWAHSSSTNRPNRARVQAGNWSYSIPSWSRSSSSSFAVGYRHRNNKEKKKEKNWTKTYSIQPVSSLSSASANDFSLLLFSCLFRVDTYGVRFITETLKSFTISSTAIKRRPALPNSPASAPQVLSPKRLCSTTKYHPASPILSILPQIVNSIATDTTTVNIHRSQLHHSTILGTTSGENTGTISVISTTNAVQNCLAQQTLQQLKHLSQSQQTPSTSIMDASMGQIVPMPSMVLSQSMDSVNTATNEEEVRASWKYLPQYLHFCIHTIHLHEFVYEENTPSPE